MLCSQVNFVSSGSTDADCQQRCKVILDTVHMNKLKLKDTELLQLESLVSEYVGYFALNPTEVGRTNLVQHHIDT